MREKSGFSVGDFKYAISIFKETKGVAMATKFEQKISQTCTDFSSVQEIEELFASKVRILGRRLQIIFKGTKGVAMATKFRKILSKIAQILLLAKIEEFFACSVGFMGFVNSNMLPEFSTEPRESPWQPKLCKNKPQFCRIQFSKSYGDNNACMVGFSMSENSNMLIKISGEQRELP